VEAAATSGPRDVIAILREGSPMEREQAAMELQKMFKDDETVAPTLCMMEFLRTVPVFTHLTNETVYDLTRLVETLDLTEGEYAMHEGEVADAVCVVRCGVAVAQRRTGEVFGKIKRGNLFGEAALREDQLLDQNRRQCDVVASGEQCVVLKVLAADFHALFGEKLSFHDISFQKLNTKKATSAKMHDTGGVIAPVIGIGKSGSLEGKEVTQLMRTSRWLMTSARPLLFIANFYHSSRSLAPARAPQVPTQLQQCPTGGGCNSLHAGQ